MSLSAPRLINKNVLTQHEFRLTIDELPNVYWTTLSGLKENKEKAEYYDGSSNRKRYANGGTFSVDDLELSIPYDLETFNRISGWVDKFRDGGTVQVTVRPIVFSQSGESQPSQVAFYCANCRFVSLDPFGELDKSSSDVSMTTLTLSLEYVSVR